jgi:hypothetical protein
MGIAAKQKSGLAARAPRKHWHYLFGRAGVPASPNFSGRSGLVRTLALPTGAQAFKVLINSSSLSAIACTPAAEAWGCGAAKGC